MLRHTAGRAFGPKEEGATLPMELSEPKSREQAVNRLFSDLHRSLVDLVRSEQIARSYANRSSPPELLRVSKERALSAGKEFVLETPHLSLRFLNDLQGIIWVHEVRDGQLVPREILSVQQGGKGYQAIRKFLGAGAGGFEFTSVRLLEASYLGDSLKRF